MKGFRQGGIESYVGEGTALGADRDTVQVFTAGIIQEAAKIGNCVIIGRSAQCLLRRHANVFRMLVYAPLKEKLVRMKLRHPHERDVPALLVASTPSVSTMHGTITTATRLIPGSTISP